MGEEYKYMVSTQCMTYNQDSYIEKTLDGFVMQETIFPVVFCVVDDASTDGEQDLLRRWVKVNLNLQAESAKTDVLEYGELLVGPLKDKPNSLFVILLLRENHYHTQKPKLPYLKEWVETAKYAAVCEGDDYWVHPRKLQMQVDFMESHEEYGMVYTAFKYYYQDANKFKDAYTPKNVKHDDNLKWELLEQKLLVGTCVPLIKTRLHDEILSYKEDFEGYMMGDTQMWFHAARLSKVGYIPEITGVYRKHLTGATATYDPKRRSRFIKSCLEMHLKMAYKYKAPLKTIKRIKKRYGIDLMNIYLKQNDYNGAREINKALFHKNLLYGLTIGACCLFHLNNISFIERVNYHLANMGLVCLK